MGSRDEVRSKEQLRGGAKADQVSTSPQVSVVILNYNGKEWLERCLESIKQQSVLDQIEVVIVDNASTDGSDRLAQNLLKGWPRGIFVGQTENLGFCEGNNRGATVASGKYLFFLNNDTWLETECLRNLCSEMEHRQAGAGGALVLNYDDDSFQSIGGTGLDWLGFPDAAPALEETRDLFATCGCAYVIRRDLFQRIGGFDAQFFLYSDETDLSWRVWISGHDVIGIPSARVHHRGAVAVNPKGGTRVIESRTSAAKRYYANRNSLLFLLKNAQHLLLLLIFPQLAYLALEAIAALVLMRNAGFVREAYVRAVIDCWGMRKHVRRCRAQIQSFRTRSDLWMLRFLRLKPSRWEEITKIVKSGAPKLASS